jgi:hypothetical protein
MGKIGVLFHDGVSCNQKQGDDCSYTPKIARDWIVQGIFRLGKLGQRPVPDSFLPFKSQRRTTDSILTSSLRPIKRNRWWWCHRKSTVLQPPFDTFHVVFYLSDTIPLVLFILLETTTRLLALICHGDSHRRTNFFAPLH